MVEADESTDSVKSSSDQLKANGGLPSLTKTLASADLSSLQITPTNEEKIFIDGIGSIFKYFVTWQPLLSVIIKEYGKSGLGCKL